MEAMAHEFFDELRDPDCTLPSKTPLPPLFNFTDEELKAAGDLRAKLQPRKSGEGASNITAPSGASGGGQATNAADESAAQAAATAAAANAAVKMEAMPEATAVAAEARPPDASQ